MAKEKNEIFAGIVTEALPNTMFRVKLDDERMILATLRGKLRRSFVKILPGVRVRVEMTKYDNERGRIIQRI